MDRQRFLVWRVPGSQYRRDSRTLIIPRASDSMVPGWVTADAYFMSDVEVGSVEHFRLRLRLRLRLRVPHSARMHKPKWAPLPGVTPDELRGATTVDCNDGHACWRAWEMAVGKKKVCGCE